nr:AMP-binding protein [Staphylococcus lugdunensis]
MKRTKREQLEIFYDEQVWDHQTLDEFIQEKVRQYPEKIALIDREFEFTYQEMYDEINHFAYKFYQDGIKPDDKVLIQLPNCFEFIFVLFALFKIGAIPVLALATHRKVEIKGVLEASGAVAYIAKDKYLGFSYSQLINEIEGELGCQINQYILGNSKQYKNFYSANRNDYDYRYSEELIKPSYNNTALLLLSGGTTGIPKLIPRRHCDYIYVAKQCAQRCGLDEHSTYLVALPIAHNFPLGCPGIIGTLAVGGAI